MKLFTRDMVLMGPLQHVSTWAIEIAQTFEDVTGQHVNVWQSVAGGTAGHFSWGYQASGTAELMENSMKAMASDAYLAKVEEGRDFFTASPTDTLYRPYTHLGEDRTRVGNVAVITQATAKAGSLGHAVGWGIEASEYVQRATGMFNALLGESAGQFSRLTWMGIAKDLAAADAADEITAGDDEYLKLIARGGNFFQDGSARTKLFLRIG